MTTQSQMRVLALSAAVLIYPCQVDTIRSEARIQTQLSATWTLDAPADERGRGAVASVNSGLSLTDVGVPPRPSVQRIVLREDHSIGRGAAVSRIETAQSSTSGASADVDCFHEREQIQFAPSSAPFGRHGLIMHDDLDFGDTAQREGMYWLGVWIRQNELKRPWVDNPKRELSFEDVIQKLEPRRDGVFLRAPGKDPFGRPSDGNENHGTTRDQLVPLIAALTVWGKHDALQRLWNALPEDILGKHDFQGHWLDATTGEKIFAVDPCVGLGNLAAALCDMKKKAGILHFTGDPLPPTAYNLFARAGVTLKAVFPVTVTAVSAAGFDAGEANLKLGIDVLRNQATGDIACVQAKPDKLDCVDQDMNSIVMLWMSRHRRSTAISESAIDSYRSRAHSYGSYFREYCEVHGPLVLAKECPPGQTGCCKDKNCLNEQLTERMRAGIASGWLPDGPGFGPYGAVRWYNRWSTKANPRLAVLWQDIIEALLR